jgi:hypothetical protein
LLGGPFFSCHAYHQGVSTYRWGLGAFKEFSQVKMMIK